MWVCAIVEASAWCPFETFVFVVDGNDVCVSFLQSTINPVDGIYQPPLDTPVVNTTMPTQTTLPTGARDLPVLHCLYTFRCVSMCLMF